MITLTKFYAEWCPYCHEIAPQINALQGKFNIIGVDVGTRENAKVYKVTHNLKCLPSVILYDNDVEVSRWSADDPISFGDFIKKFY